ncbi:hypothetical protein GJU40_01960 [Bacillus lacus]|uniref:Uncharacterized protein n=1 Tax=Metabacillus lacus TaxID=1983721 RepID=A0A7X2IWV2_9BACI|nr:hypothetical protein [Metabacillus lacus]MRX70932.1 hypothetical protein [Metabacillus lacus]
MEKINYQVCAACIHFRSLKGDGRRAYYCDRLGYETMPHYSFSCWTPKKSVLKIMKKRGDNDARSS